MKNFYLVICCLFLATGLLAQGVTTSSISGSVTDENGEPLIGATVSATHQPSGSFYGSSTNLEGRYNLANLRVGGPYRIVVSYVGFGEQVFKDVFLSLGQRQYIDVELQEGAMDLEAVDVIARAGVSGQTAGASTQINSETVDALPTLDRDINDFLRLTPQANLVGDGISFAGMNNRYNAIYVDGAVNNDVFGLASSGTNGGQIGISPFSIDIIDQFQVVMSPYDVSLGGFAGGGINAVTKSGTNEFKGSAYYYFQNEGLVGKTNKEVSNRFGVDRTSVDEFSESVYGLSLGGPIVKDKVFFFANLELQDDVSPNPFDPETYTSQDGRASIADLQNLRSFLIENYNYDPGNFGSTERALEGTKFFGKIDINLNQNHKLTLRHQYTNGESFGRSTGNSNTIQFENTGVFFPSETNSSAIELNSTFGENISNNLIIGFTSVRDNRGPLGSAFPYVEIEDGNRGVIEFGSEQFSTANQLDQDIFALTNNFKLYRGNHTITLGTHNEFYKIFNLFIRQNFGVYAFDSLDDFLQGNPASEYDRSYSLVDDAVGSDQSGAAAQFNAMQLGFYAQDEWQVNRKLTLTYGLRLDVPIITDDPAEDTYLNTVALPEMRKQYEVANDVMAGSAPDGQLMFSPRAGFEYDFHGNRSMVLRGGLGIFTSRIPFVWPGAMFNNNGLSIGSVSEGDIEGDIEFRPDINNQYTNPDFTVPSGQVDLFVEDFKYPQVFRTNLAVDKQFDNGLVASLEGIYTKTLNNVLYTNINSDQSFETWTDNGGDDRKIFSGTNIDDTYSAVYVASNTSEGYGYNLTASLAKRFDFGLTASLAYTYGDSEAVSEGTSSQNSSQWRGQINIDGRNNPVLGRSDFSVGHRIVSALIFRLPWGEEGVNSTTFSLFYNGQSGSPFSYVIGGRDARNINNETGSTSRNRTLVYVPESMDDINLVSYTNDDGEVVTPEEQWTNLSNLIDDDKNLDDRRGDYAKKGGSYAPFTNILDLSVRQDLGLRLGGNTHKVQLSLDVFNLANLINPEWGVTYFVEDNVYQLYGFEGYEADGTTPTFTYRDDEVGDDKFDIAGFSSRWRMRLGLRYIFN